MPSVRADSSDPGRRRLRSRHRCPGFRRLWFRCQGIRRPGPILAIRVALDFEASSLGRRATAHPAAPRLVDLPARRQDCSSPARLPGCWTAGDFLGRPEHSADCRELGPSIHPSEFLGRDSFLDYSQALSQLDRLEHSGCFHRFGPAEQFLDCSVLDSRLGWSLVRQRLDCRPARSLNPTSLARSRPVHSRRQFPNLLLPSRRRPRRRPNQCRPTGQRQPRGRGAAHSRFHRSASRER